MFHPEPPVGIKFVEEWKFPYLVLLAPLKRQMSFEIVNYSIYRKPNEKNALIGNISIETEASNRKRNLRDFIVNHVYSIHLHKHLFVD